MSVIRLNDGSECAVTYCGEAEGVVSFQTAEAMTVLDAAERFAAPEVTGKIEYYLPAFSPRGAKVWVLADEYEGYTDLVGVLRDRSTGRVLVQLASGGE